MVAKVSGLMFGKLNRAAGEFAELSGFAKMGVDEEPVDAVAISLSSIG